MLPPTLPSIVRLPGRRESGTLSHGNAGRNAKMSDQPRKSAAPVEAYFDHTPQPFGDGPPDPLVYDASPRALRQRTVNFAAKRLADMRYVSGLDRGTAERHFRWRSAVAPGGLGFRAAPDGEAELAAAQRRGDIVIGRYRPPRSRLLERRRIRRARHRRCGCSARLWRD